MGQKTNAVALRLGNRLGWKSVWNSDSCNFSAVLFKDLEARYYTELLFKSFGLSTNNLFCEHWKGLFSLSGKLFNISDFMSFLGKQRYLSLANRKIILNRYIAGFSHISPVSSQISFSFTGPKDFYYDFNKVKESGIVGISTKGFWPTISSQSIANLLAHQLTLPMKLRDRDFKRSLRKGVVELVKVFFNRKGIFFISGIKIICSGRWQKTKSSRKQRLAYSFGKLKLQTFSNFLDYGFTSVTTKYGSCGIKVWISYKKH